MLYIARDFALILLAIVGICEVARAIILFFLDSKHDESIVIVVPITCHMEDAEHLLRGTAAKVRFMGIRRFKKVICLNLDADEETKTICNKICSEFPFMEFTEKNQLQKEFVT
ncbi:hypothetical protein AGMMS50284_4010 [Clostridia bacterium]|nr:hypothetical protein AGMMS50284_4010 [Clostridia bacterium]